MFRNKPFKHTCHNIPKGKITMPYVPTTLAVMLLLVSALPAHGGKIEPPTVHFEGQGFRVQAPAGATLLEVRLRGPQRTLILEKRTAGAPISWTLDGGDGDGDYRYEAVVVTEIDGKPRQRNASGGFEVQGGLLIAPPTPAGSDGRASP